jgi:hypothetical protein
MVETKSDFCIFAKVFVKVFVFAKVFAKLFVIFVSFFAKIRKRTFSCSWCTLYLAYYFFVLSHNLINFFVRMSI